MKKFVFLELIKKAPISIKRFWLSTYITNMGNGMFTIAISKLLYDKTGSFLAFGLVIVIENVLSFLIQLFAGYIADARNPQKIAVKMDFFRGTIILISGIILIFISEPLKILPVTLVVVGIMHPFYKAANFKFVSIVERKKLKLIEVNSVNGALYQAGQFSGIALAAPLLFFFNPIVVVIVNAITYLIAGSLIKKVSLMTEINQVKISKNLIIDSIREWKNTLLVMKNTDNQLLHVFGMAGDYVSINFFNLMLVPLVLIRYNNIVYVSIFDSSFAIGSMCSFLIIVNLIKRFTIREISWFGQLMQGVNFLLLAFTDSIYIAFPLMLTFGVYNGISVAILKSSAQKRFDQSIRGKIGSLKNLFVSLLTLTLIPLASLVFDHSLENGLILSGVIMISFAIIQLRITKSQYFLEYEW